MPLKSTLWKSEFDPIRPLVGVHRPNADHDEEVYFWIQLKSTLWRSEFEVRRPLVNVQRQKADRNADVYLLKPLKNKITVDIMGASSDGPWWRCKGRRQTTTRKCAF